MTQNRFRSVQKQTRDKADASLFQSALCTRPKVINLKKHSLPSRRATTILETKKTDKLTSPFPEDKQAAERITEPDLAKTIVVSKQQTPAAPSGDLFRVPKINSKMSA
mmetsp:Transcript_5509/g.8642  ORF Transcript_5509/g.8642 Transcript_5509/m.8642 type:complete len:108 (+) Transcript_5509:478-801(+)